MKAKESHYSLIKHPVMSEKATLLGESNKYVFVVDSAATKSQVKSAVEVIFNVKVKAVNTSKTQGKVKRFRGRVGKRNDYKKAVVTLMPDNSIDVNGSVK